MNPTPPRRLKRRADFLRAAKGVRVHAGAFTLQAGRRASEAIDEGGPVARLGFTVTKKVGNAVERNRIRRRLREAIRLGEALPTDPETDYVLVARREALTIPFGRLLADLSSALRRSGDRSSRTRGAGRDRRTDVT